MNKHSFQISQKIARKIMKVESELTICEMGFQDLGLCSIGSIEWR